MSIYKKMSDCFANQFRDEEEAREWVNKIEKLCKVEFPAYDYFLTIYPNDLKSLMPIFLSIRADELTIYCPLPDGFERDDEMSQHVTLIQSEELKITCWWD